MSSNVVDHLAPGVTEPHLPAGGSGGANGANAAAARRAHADKIITVQPLRKDEMQVSVVPSRFRLSTIDCQYPDSDNE